MSQLYAATAAAVLGVPCSMAGQHHTAEAYATGVRNLRERLPDMWMAKGDEWVSLPLLWAR